jgi:hypothetical protein
VEVKTLVLLFEAAMKFLVLMGFAHLFAHTIVWLWKMGG